MFIKRIGFSLIRVHRRQTLTTNQSNVQLQCQQLKWPIEYIFAGLKMADYGNSGTITPAEHLDKWHAFNQVVPQTRNTLSWKASRYFLKNSALTLAATTIPASTFNNASNAVLTNAILTASASGITSASSQIAVGDILVITPSVVTGGTVAPVTLTVLSILEGLAGAALVITFEESSAYLQSVWGSGSSNATVASAPTVSQSRKVSQEVSSTVRTVAATLDTVNIKAHGIDLYQQFPAQFYASYLTFVFGGPNVNVPADKGCIFVNFCLYPGTYQPSGHVNISRAREFYFNFTSSVIGGSPSSPNVVNQPAMSTPSNNGYLYLLAIAINFLLISDGGAVLRYST